MYMSVTDVLACCSPCADARVGGRFGHTPPEALQLSVTCSSEVAKLFDPFPHRMHSQTNGIRVALLMLHRRSRSFKPSLQGGAGVPPPPPSITWPPKRTQCRTLRITYLPLSVVFIAMCNHPHLRDTLHAKFRCTSHAKYRARYSMRIFSGVYRRRWGFSPRLRLTEWSPRDHRSAACSAATQQPEPIGKHASTDISAPTPPTPRIATSILSARLAPVLRPRLLLVFILSGGIQGSVATGTPSGFHI